MKSMDLSISYGDFPGFPSDAVVVAIRVEVTPVGSPPLTAQQVPPGTVDVVFADLPNGDYTYSVAGIGVGQVVYGTPVTGSFSVADAPVTITLSLPTLVNVSPVA